MTSMLNHFIDFQYNSKLKVFTFENDDEIIKILDDESIPENCKRDTVKHRIYKGELKFESEKDLIPYYPYIVGFSATTNGIGEIRLSTKSYVDRRERERLEFYTKECQGYVSKCKRKKIKVNLDHFNNQYYKDTYKEILTRLVDKSKEFTLDEIEIYLPMTEYYRKELYDEMVKNEWESNNAKLWCFGCRKEYPI